MYCSYKDREELEDDLYREEEGDSEGSEANSELEFHLYSQLHYASNTGELEEQERRGQDSQQLDVIKKITDGDEKQAHAGESRILSRNTDRLQQHLSQQKGEKRDSKGQRSSLLQEVIVIDSSPDVISISEDDTTDDDKGVCALKGQRLQRLQTSTPAPQETHTRKRSLSVPISVDSSSSESESEGLHASDFSDSDSDCIEHWMILGQGKQDGDQSMSLNLEGGHDSNTEDDDDGGWLISDKDKEAHIFNKDRGARMAVQRVSNRYYTDKNVHCRNCNKIGHLSKNCPQPKKQAPCFLCGTTGHRSSECFFRHCNNCGLPGHLYESCTEKPYWHKKCHRCNMMGHFFDACPEIWRQYHITTEKGLPVRRNGEDKGRSPAYCYNCSKKGHYGHACIKQRMFSRTYPTIPFINHYDTMQDIIRRQHRIKFKVKDLKQTGLFPTSSIMPETPEHPKKKQKLHHYKNNNQPNHKAPQTPSSCKPNPSHLIFIEKEDGLVTVPKAKKANKNRKVTCGSAKQWKPKRPVPNSRDLLPSTKVVLDEADDFPRGGQNTKGRVKKNKFPPLTPHAPMDKHLKRQFWTGTTETQRLPAKWRKKEKEGGRKKRNRAWRKRCATEVYPADDNLFTIKQRRRTR